MKRPPHSPSCPGIVAQMRCSFMTLIEHCADTCVRKMIGFVCISRLELLLKGELISFTLSVMPADSARDVQTPRKLTNFMYEHFLASLMTEKFYMSHREHLACPH